MKKFFDRITDRYIKFYYPVAKVFISILIVLFSIVVFVQLAIIITKDKYLFGVKIYAVESESMLPTIKKGDLVIIDEVYTYHKDDIITYTDPNDENQTITHRIINIFQKTSGDETFVTKGDNNEIQDPFQVTKEMIQGKVIKIIPAIGNWALFSRSVIGIILLLIIPATMLLTLNAVSIFSWIKARYVNNT
ncbi:signal peptidase I [Candidatus Dojkabacteria bacterium]|nr:signal peptidase I [Candidatus Dojkabacteria bacterium]